MKVASLAFLLFFSFILKNQCAAQTYDTNGDFVETFAGSGFSGYLDGQGTQTMFNEPLAVVVDSSGNLFVMDYGNERIREISPGGTVSTFAGGGTGSLPGYGTNVGIGYAIAMTIDHSNALYLVTWAAETSMLRIQSNGYVTSIPLSGLSGGGGRDGICVDSSNNVYISDGGGNIIYRYRTNGLFEVFAGSGNKGAIDGNGVFTSFNSPSTLTSDAADNIYVWDSGNNLIRRINQNRDVNTIAGRQGVASNSDGLGTNATFNGISAMCTDSLGNVYIASFSYPGSAFRKMTATTNVTTLAGSFTQAGYTNGIGSLARFDFGDEGICISQGTIFVADGSNERIRSITNNPTAQPVSPANLHLSTYPGLQIIGTVGRAYQIQSSPDMQTWTTQATLLLTSSPYLWIDQNPVSSNKFYQALLLP